MEHTIKAQSKQIFQLKKTLILKNIFQLVKKHKSKRREREEKIDRLKTDNNKIKNIYTFDKERLEKKGEKQNGNINQII